jgi:hypothetical protein
MLPLPSSPSALSLQTTEAQTIVTPRSRCSPTIKIKMESNMESSETNDVVEITNASSDTKLTFVELVMMKFL